MFLLVASAIGTNAAPDTQTYFRKLLTEVAALRKLRDARIAAIPDVPADSYDGGCLELVLHDVAYGSDMIVQLVRRDGKWTTGAARERQAELTVHWKPTLTPHVFEAQAGKLTIDRNGVHGDLTVQLLLWVHDKRFEPTNAQPIPCKYRVAIKPGQEGWKGTAQLAEPMMIPLTAEQRQVEAKWIPAGRPRPRPALKAPPSDTMRTMFEEATAAAQEAHRLYEELRAIQLQKERGIPVEIGLDTVTRWHVLYSEPVIAEAKAATKQKKPAGPNLDDLDALDDLDVGDAEESPEVKRKKAELARAKAEAIRGMVEHVIEMRTLAEGNAKEIRAVQIGDADPGDPDFGPFSAIVPLERKAGVSHLVPADIGKQGPQEWRHVKTWDVLGPFPQNLWMSHTTVLPDIVPDSDGTLLAETNLLHGFQMWGRYWGKGKHEWTRIECDPLNGRVKPPAWMVNKKYPWAGKDWGALYAVCELESAADNEPWAAMVLSDGGALWVNDRLAWRSGFVPDWSDINVFRFRLPLRKGANRIMVRCENHRVPHRFGLRICTAGQPRPPDVVAKSKAATDAAYDAVKSPYAGTIGFRNDQSGRFPDAKPVVAFDLEKRINVPWRVPLRINNGAPLAVKDKIFTMVEPMTLLCLNANDGTVLWTRHIDPLELRDPERYEKTLPLKEQWLKAMLARDLKKEAEIAKKLNELYPRELQIVWDGKPWSGNVGSTPVTDGKLVWVKGGHRIVSCLDFHGNVKWQGLCKPTGGSNHDRLSSPFLVQRKDGSCIVVCQVPRADKSGRLYILKAWDAATGKELWETGRYIMGGRGHGLGTDTPHLMRLANGNNEVDVIVSSGGRVFRATDGKTLHPYTGSMTTQATPIDNGHGVVLTMFGRAYVGASAATRLILVDRDTVFAETLWKRHGYDRYGCWVLRDGIAWGYERKDVSSFELLTGHRRGRVDHAFAYSTGHNYAPPALAGDIVFAADDERSGHNNMANWSNATFPDKPKKTPLPSCVSTVLPGPEPLVLARNTSEGITMGLGFRGDRWFVRSRKSLFCVAYTGDEGRRYETETVARTLLDQMQMTVPDDSKPLPAPPQSVVPKEFDPVRLRIELPLTHWNVLGPFAAGDEATVRKALGFGGGTRLATGRGNTAIRGAGTNKVMGATYTDELVYPPKITTGHHHFGVTLDLSLVHKGKAGSVVFWSALLHNPHTRILRLDLDSPHAQFFIGGKRIAHNQRVYLPHGNYVFEMRTLLPEAGDPVTIRPRLWPSNDVKTECERRLLRLSRARPRLERLTEAMPDSRLASAIDKLLPKAN